MKKIIFLSVLFISQSLFAAPAVGDRAVYLGLQNGGSFEIVLELTDFDPDSNSFLQVTKTHSSGKRRTKSEWKASKDITSADRGKFIVENCIGYNGFIEEIVIGPHELTTCNLILKGVRYNIAEVPFGVVRLRSDDLEIDLLGWDVGNESN